MRASVCFSLLLTAATLAAPATIRCQAGGAQAQVRRLSQSDQGTVYRLSYMLAGRQSQLVLPATPGELSASSVSLKPAAAQHASPVVVLDFNEDAGRESYHHSLFAELRGGKLQLLPQIPVSDEATAKRDGATPSPRPPELFSAATLLLDRHQGMTRPLDTYDRRERYFLVERSDRSHAVVWTSQLLSSSSLEEPGQRGPEPELNILKRPLRLWLTISGQPLLVPQP